MMIARIETDEDLTAALKDRRVALGLTQEDVEHRVNLAAGHIGKIEHGGKTWGKSILRMTATLNWLLELYGLTLLIADKETAAKLTGPMMQHRPRPHLNKASGEFHPSAQRLLFRLTRRPA